MYSLKQISEITGAVFKGKNNYPVSVFCADSRSITDPANSLFIAIKTNKNNGHKYIKDVLDKGITSLLVKSGEIDLNEYNNISVSLLVCDDPLQALQKLASYHRMQFNIPIIGITGSNGKTIVKEWLYQLLKTDYSICRSPRSFNSQLGVPLSILNLNERHTLGIFEAGISKPNEMENISDIIKPSICVFTSIGSAHDEGFIDRKQKIKEKLKLAEHCQLLIANGLEQNDIPHRLSAITELISNTGNSEISYSFYQNTLKLNYKQKTVDFEIPFNDEASILNFPTCIITLLNLGVPETIISERLKTLQPIALRLEIKNGINNSLIINDYYNSDLDSLKIALSFLQQQNRRQYKTVIISDIEQSGVLDNTLYKEIARLIAANKVDLLIGIGEKITAHKTFFKLGSLFFESTEKFTEGIQSILHRFNNSTVLLKGARSFGFEAISNLLQHKSHDTVLEINLNKLTDNLNYYRSLIAPDVKIMCMVKAMGYGGGGSELARTLQHHGVSYLAVAYADEGVELRQSQILLPIMVMSPETDAFEDIINYKLEPEIYNFKSLTNFVSKLDHLGISEPYPVHLKIDTGMHRLGFDKRDIIELIKALKQTQQIKVQSVFSHLAGSDNASFDEFTKNQILDFDTACFQLKEALGYTFIKHICNSGGISRFPQAHFNMVRLGIGMHGVGVNDNEQANLKIVASLKAKIIQIKNINKDSTVGYNRNYKATSDIVLAIIPIGYADGFSRKLGNANFGVYVNNTYCKTIGNICMDMCMIDVTGVNCKEGDEVIVFENIDQLRAMADAADTITYEILTGVSGRVKRVYVQE